MHGRLKVKTTAEQQEEKNRERAKKLALYRAGYSKATEKRENKEYDQEALNISQQLLSANPDLYTIWNFRKEIVLHLKQAKTDDEATTMFKEELLLTETCLRVNPKSYGAWHHRCWALDTTPIPDWNQELKLCNQYLELDERNFHCWDYRRFVASRAKVQPEDELEFTMKKINNNFSNYSAWHYRSKLLPLVYGVEESGRKTTKLQEDIHLQELELVQNAAFTDPNDQSAWFYHRWLLGRADQPAVMRNLYVSRSKARLLVCFSKPVSINSTNIEVCINSKVIPMDWKPSLDSLTHSAVWMSRLPKDELVLAEPLEFKVNAAADEVDSELHLTLVDDEVWTLGSSTLPFRLELSTATEETLVQELESCNQLLELEPDSKWTLLTSVLLMSTIDPHKHEENVMVSLGKLIQIDSYRTHYYEDLLSRFVIENGLDRHNVNQRHLDLSKRQLTTLYHSNHMLLIKSLDVSRNRLRSLRPIHNLQCLETLMADYNQITDCRGLECITTLKSVSLTSNQIYCFENLEPLKECKDLRKLIVVSNPICNQNPVKQWCTQYLPLIEEVIS